MNVKIGRMSIMVVMLPLMMEGVLYLSWKYMAILLLNDSHSRKSCICEWAQVGMSGEL